MRNIKWLVAGWIVTAFGWVSPGFTQAFTSLPDGAVKHVASGWVFPKTQGEFQRGSDPTIAPGTTADAVGEYERSANGLRTTATVYVYPPDSPADDGGLAGAREAIEAKLASVRLAQVWSQGPFKAGEAPGLVGEKTFYKIGIGANSSQTNLYYFNTGKWIVKVRMSVQKTEKETFQLLDSFVRGLPWRELGLTAESCTGSACKVSRPIPTHGALPEQLAVLLATQKLEEIIPSKPPACDLDTLVTAFAASGGRTEPISAVAACSPKKGVRASFLRMDLGQDIRDELEKKSPDGLSLRGPMSFVVRSDGKKSIYTMLIDGPLDAATIEQMLKGLDGDSDATFAKADKQGMNPQLESRFLGGE